MFALLFWPDLRKDLGSRPHFFALWLCTRVTLDHGSFHFAVLPLTYTLGMGLLLATVRVRTGSLPGPLLMHNTMNVTAEMIAWLPSAAPGAAALIAPTRGMLLAKPR
ncbi:type II CAAX prenyl endopeptidase Rce1 family protein [Acidipila sp. EB88]|uniref:CPBP family glutamic-type intramembrane protease n=1 Tax=Acidipila sp. EB88 TaxID=2305226 RepID=UPI0035120BD1